MYSAFDILFSWQFAFFCLGIFAIIWLIRTVVEYIFPSIATKEIWTKLILKIAPSIFGGVIGILASKYTYPNGFNTTSDRFFFGLVAGLLSAMVYDLIKDNVLAKIQQFQNPQPNISFISPISTFPVQQPPNLPANVQSNQPVNPQQSNILPGGDGITKQL